MLSCSIRYLSEVNKAAQPESTRDSLGAILRWHYQHKKARNSNYSVRAFARDLGVPASNLSSAMNEKRGFAVPTLHQICDTLGLSDAERSVVLNATASQFARSHQAKIEAQKRVDAESVYLKQLTSSEFSIISKWHHLAILCLSHVEGSLRLDAKYARRLALRLTS